MSHCDDRCLSERCQEGGTILPDLDLLAELTFVISPAKRASVTDGRAAWNGFHLP
jgi:hypothetical protein